MVSHMQQLSLVQKHWKHVSILTSAVDLIFALRMLNVTTDLVDMTVFATKDMRVTDTIAICTHRKQHQDIAPYPLWAVTIVLKMLCAKRECVFVKLVLLEMDTTVA
jgi:hypothetical protein